MFDPTSVTGTRYCLSCANVNGKTTALSGNALKITTVDRPNRYGAPVCHAIGLDGWFPTLGSGFFFSFFQSESCIGRLVSPSMLLLVSYASQNYPLTLLGAGNAPLPQVTRRTTPYSQPIPGALSFRRRKRGYNSLRARSFSSVQGQLRHG